MNSPTFTKTFVKDGAVAPYRICTVGGSDNTVSQAADGTTPLIGISNRLGAPDSGDLRVDVNLGGIVLCEAGDDVTLGASVMADSAGKAIDATEGNYSVGVALAAAADGDLFPVLIAPHQLANAGA